MTRLAADADGQVSLEEFTNSVAYHYRAEEAMQYRGKGQELSTHELVAILAEE